MRVGVLALQGDFREHLDVLKKLQVDSMEIRTADDLRQVDALILPGGESTTMAIVAERSKLMQPLRDFVKTRPVWGTCAGMILLAKHAHGQKQGGQALLEALDVTVQRNYFGSQVDSFESDFNIPELGDKPVHCVFIRAPVITEVNSKDIKILAKISEHEIVAVQQSNILATAFHPELSTDTRWHEYFVRMAEQQLTSAPNALTQSS